MIRRPPRSTQSRSSAASDVYKRQRLCPVALLVLLPAAARARIVAPDLVVDDPLLHGHGARARRGAAALAASGGHVARRRVREAVFGRRPGLAGGQRRAGERGLRDEVVAARVVQAHERLLEGDGREHGKILGVVLHERRDGARLDAVHHVLEEVEPLALVLDQRVALAESAQVDALLQVVHVEQVVLPARVDDLQHHGALDAAHLLLADEALALVVLSERVVDGEVDDFLQRRRAEIDVALLEGRVVDLPETDEEGVEVPLLGELLALEVHAHRALHKLADHLADLLAKVLAHEDALPLAVDHTPLLVHDLVVLEHVLAAQEVELLHLDLRLLDHAAQHLGLERLSLLGPQAAEDAVHAVAGEQADELVLRGQVEARVTGVSLPAGTAAQLVVDAPALVALGAEHVEAAGLDDALAELDVDAAAGHVGRDRERAFLAGVLDDLGLALVLLGVQHVVLHAVPHEETREHLADLHRDRADEHRLTLLVARDEVVDDGRELLLSRREDEVICLLYTSDAADDLLCVDLGGRRIIKK